MKWLADLLRGREYKPASLAPGPNDKVETPLQSVDWKDFQARLLELLRQDLSRFAANHSDEVFYAVALDCNALYGDILLCANTPFALRERASEYSQDPSDKAVARQEKILRWGFGDWKYHGINLDLSGGIQRYKDLLAGHDEITHPADQERFLKAASRALINLESSPEIALLSRTSDFQVMCADHDEDLSVGKRRLARVRRAVA
jgi:hypothetical protein